MTTAPAVGENQEFSLVSGGPLYQLLLRAKLVQPPIGRLNRRVLACVLVTWLPLAVLTAMTGSFLDGAGVPFLFDVGTHVRFLLAVPLLIGAELIVHRRVRGFVDEFPARGLIAPADRPQYGGMVAGAVRLRNSVVVEALLLLVSFTVGYWVWRTQTSLHVATWYSVPADDSEQLTAAGAWYAFVSLPIGRFLLLRWYFRLFIWYLFLWRVSRLRLNLDPLHPDRAGGLGFLEGSLFAFAPVMVAQSVLVAGMIGDLIWHAGAGLPEFKLEIAAFVAFLLLLVLLPLTFFALSMVEARSAALRDFGRLAARYADDFRRKWLEGCGPADESLLGTGDIQSLADLANSFDVVRNMQALPFGLKPVIRLAVVIALPILPLVLTMIPVEELAQRLIRLLM